MCDHLAQPKVNRTQKETQMEPVAYMCHSNGFLISLSAQLGAWSWAASHLDTASQAAFIPPLPAGAMCMHLQPSIFTAHSPASKSIPGLSLPHPLSLAFASPTLKMIHADFTNVFHAHSHCSLRLCEYSTVAMRLCV